MSASGQKFYEDEEAEQILRLASSISSPVGKMSHERLLETAAELGITPEAVEAAEQQYSEQRREQGLRAQFDTHIRREFFTHLVSYLVMTTFFIVLNLLTSPHYFWAAWPMIGWGLGLFAHGRCALVRSGECYEEEFAKWQARRADPASARLDDLRRRTRPRGLYMGVHMGPRSRARLRRRWAEHADSVDS